MVVKDRPVQTPSRRSSGISDQDCDFAVVFTCGPAAYSSFASQGRFELVDASGARVNIIPTPTGGTTGLFTFDKNNNNAFVAGFPVGFGFNRDNLRRIATPVERCLGSGIFNHEVLDGHTAFAEVTYAKTKSSSQIEPLAIANTDLNSPGYAIDNPFIPFPFIPNVTGTETAADVYDPFGRRFYVGAQVHL